MAVAVKDNYDIALKEQQKEVRNMVLAGLENIKEGKTKEKVYEEAILEFLKNQSQEQVIQDGKIEELLNAKLGNIDKHLSSMIGQLSKDLALVYGTSIYNLQKNIRPIRFRY